jgi:hypothetical protein
MQRDDECYSSSVLSNIGFIDIFAKSVDLPYSTVASYAEMSGSGFDVK